MPVTCRATCGREDGVRVGLEAIELPALVVGHARDDVLLHPRAAVGQRGVDAGEFVQAHGARAQVARRKGRDVGGDAAAVGVIVERVEPDHVAHAPRGVVVGLHQRVVHPQDLFAAARRRLRLAQVERRRIDRAGRIVALGGEGGGIEQRLDRRTHLPPGLHRAVVLAQRPVARADHGADRPIHRVLGEERTLEHVAVGQAGIGIAAVLRLALATLDLVDPRGQRVLRRRLQARVDRGVDLEPALLDRGLVEHAFQLPPHLAGGEPAAEIGPWPQRERLAPGMVRLGLGDFFSAHHRFQRPVPRGLSRP